MSNYVVDLFSKKVAQLMGLDTLQNASLWKDRVLVEVNLAVLHSYKEAGVTLVDHHTASEQFMSHLDTEYRVRGGCPADWVWIVPPMSSSITPVFHMEMLHYKLKPSYEYQTKPWITYKWPGEEAAATGKRKITSIKSLLRAVRFASALMHKALSKRVKCTILYATETGKSRLFAEHMLKLMGRGFNAKMTQMDEYEITDLDTEQFILVVTSTFGNGEPPENGKTLFMAIKDRVSHKKTLENLRYAVFALGSTAYPHFCEFGQDLHNAFLKLEAERVLNVCMGDELSGQDEAFKSWSNEVFRESCCLFEIDESVVASTLLISSLSSDTQWSANSYKISAVKRATISKAQQISKGLTELHKQNIVSVPVKDRTLLKTATSSDKSCLVVLDISKSSSIKYEPGDHAVVYPQNNKALVDAILVKMRIVGGMDTPLKIQVKNNVLNNGWGPYLRLPTGTSLRTALTCYLDITTPPSQGFLAQLVPLARSKTERKRLEKLSEDVDAHALWRNTKSPTFLNVLEEFSSLKLEPSFVLSQMPIMKARYYSISSSMAKYPGELHLTIAVVQYEPPDSSATTKYGVCSNWLNQVQRGDVVNLYTKSNPAFHLPSDDTRPVILVGAGSGIAPLRGFWQQREMKRVPGKMLLYFGCQHPDKDDLFKTERKEMSSKGIFSHSYTAFSRYTSKKVYVQDLLYKNGASLYKDLVKENGHLYICGSVDMADGVKSIIKRVFSDQGHMSTEKADSVLEDLKSKQQWHEDIFGARKVPEIAKLTKTNNNDDESQLNQTQSYGKSKQFPQKFPVLPRIATESTDKNGFQNVNRVGSRRPTESPVKNGYQKMNGVGLRKSVDEQNKRNMSLKSSTNLKKSTK